MTNDDYEAMEEIRRAEEQYELDLLLAALAKCNDSEADMINDAALLFWS